LRGLVEKEEETQLAGLSAHLVRLFRFDSEEECIFVANGQYIYSVCYDGANPNDPDFETNKEITKYIRESFVFEETTVGGAGNISESLIGEWQSADDAKSVKVLKVGGVAEDLYDGELMNSGTWEVVSSVLSVGESPTGAFLKTIVDGDEFIYSIVSISYTELTLTYLARGNTLEFVRLGQE